MRYLVPRQCALLAAALTAAGCGEIDVVGQVELGPVRDAAMSITGARDAAAASDATVLRSPSEASELGLRTCEQAPSVFAQALCACERAAVFGGLDTASLAFAERLEDEADEGSDAVAHVHVSGPLEVTGLSGTVAGDVKTIGAGVTVLNGDGGRIEGNLFASTDVGVTGQVSIAGDAFLTGGLIGPGQVAVEGDLHTESPQDGSAARVELGGEALVEPIALSRPCLCDTDSTLDIATFVARAGSDNDNRETAFEPTALSTSVPEPLSLPGGRLFVHAIDVPGDLRLRVDGQTTLFVAGDVRVAGDLQADIGPDGELAIFVAGDAALGGAVTLGDERSSIGRLYLAGGADMDGPARGRGTGRATARGQEARWRVHLYAPRLALSLGGHAEVVGSLYVRSLLALGGLSLHYDHATATHTEVCGGT